MTRSRVRLRASMTRNVYVPRKQKQSRLITSHFDTLLKTNLRLIVVKRSERQGVQQIIACPWFMQEYTGGDCSKKASRRLKSSGDEVQFGYFGYFTRRRSSCRVPSAWPSGVASDSALRTHSATAASASTYDSSLAHTKLRSAKYCLTASCLVDCVVLLIAQARMRSASTWRSR